MLFILQKLSTFSISIIWIFAILVYWWSFLVAAIFRFSLRSYTLDGYWFSQRCVSARRCLLVFFKWRKSNGKFRNSNFSWKEKKNSNQKLSGDLYEKNSPSSRSPMWQSMVLHCLGGSKINEILILIENFRLALSPALGRTFLTLDSTFRRYLFLFVRPQHWIWLDSRAEVPSCVV